MSHGHPLGRELIKVEIIPTFTGTIWREYYGPEVYNDTKIDGALITLRVGPDRCEVQFEERSAA